MARSSAAFFFAGIGGFGGWRGSQAEQSAESRADVGRRGAEERDADENGEQAEPGGAEAGIHRAAAQHEQGDLRERNDEQEQLGDAEAEAQCGVRLRDDIATAQHHFPQHEQQRQEDEEEGCEHLGHGRGSGRERMRRQTPITAPTTR